MNAAEAYLAEVAAVHSTGAGVPETSYYPALSNLFNEIGKGLTPRVRAVINLKNRGAGLPDGGFFTADQLERTRSAIPIPTPPARGALEVKPPSEDAFLTADGEQVTRYWRQYRQVLVTNLRDFVLVGQDAKGMPVKLETFRLARSERDFWRTARDSKTLPAHTAAAFIEYLTRVLLQSAALVSPKDLAFFLASYARDASGRLEGASLSALDGLRTALEEALGLKFEGEKGAHFFRASLVQTLFYGVFSAWTIWSKKAPAAGARFDWRLSAHYLQVPIIRKLFHEVSEPGQMTSLGLAEVLDWAGATLNRVDRPAFFASFAAEVAIQYFYEPFLEAYDPALRKELGVWYTRPEVVKYIVARIDTILRTRHGLADGLADPRVYVLDPAAGTGSFLVEVVRQIARTLRGKEAAAMAPASTKAATLQRVFGFEILPAPFIVAHLQLGRLLQELGAPLDEKKAERASVYLTNSLTGWEPPAASRAPLLFPELEDERDLAEHVKRDTPVLVVLGNPPYNAFAGVSPKEELGLVAPYKEGLKDKWKIRKFNLDDLYIRFFRLAERRIADMTGEGIVAYISSFSYLSDPSFVVMRERFLTEFDSIWIDCLNGDSRETGKLTPEGEPDPSIFSTEYNREGIRSGTAIGILSRPRPRSGRPAVVRYRDFWGVSKAANLLNMLSAADFDAGYSDVRPAPENRYSFRPVRTSLAFDAWPKVVDLCGEPPISGLQEMRRGDLMDVDREPLQRRMRAYFDPKVAWKELTEIAPGLTHTAGGFKPEEARDQLRRDPHVDGKVLRYALYPLDVRWCYHSDSPALWNRPRPDLVAQAWPGNRFFIARLFAERPHERIPVTMTPHLPDYHLLRPNVIAIPVQLRERLRFGSSGHATPKANLSAAARAYLSAIGVKNSDQDAKTASLLWLHALAVGHSPKYLEENADGIRGDYPRVPLPLTLDLLRKSAALGETLAQHLDSDSPDPGVTVGTIGAAFRVIGVPNTRSGRAIDASRGDLRVTAGWGHHGRDDIVMPGRGRVVDRHYTMEEADAFARHHGDPASSLGAATLDVFLNDDTYIGNVPTRVWEYTIGGYQVLKKWLSYREEAILGRPITLDELRLLSELVRRVAAIVLMEGNLDDVYDGAKGSSYPWPSAAATAPAEAPRQPQ